MDSHIRSYGGPDRARDTAEEEHHGGLFAGASQFRTMNSGLSAEMHVPFIIGSILKVC